MADTAAPVIGKIGHGGARRRLFRFHAPSQASRLGYGNRFAEFRFRRARQPDKTPKSPGTCPGKNFLGDAQDRWERVFFQKNAHFREYDGFLYTT
jgi:hypothetical protein